MSFRSSSFAVGLTLCAALVGGAKASPQAPDDTEKLQRLSILTTRLQDRREHGDELLSEAVKICGFKVQPDSFFTSHGAAASLAASTDPNNNLYVSESEMREFSDLYHGGQWTNLADLVASLDKLAKSIGLTTSCKPYVYGWLQDGRTSANRETRLITSFIRDLGNAHANVNDITISDATSLDAIQSFLVMRVMTEELEIPLRKRLAGRHALETLQQSVPDILSGTATSAVDLLPEGFATNSYVVSIAGYLPKVEAWVEGLEEGKLTGALSKLNPILAVVKVVASYACLRGDMEMEAPGAPLVRTKSWHADDAGEKRTITAHFYYDKDKARDFMNSNLAYFNALGISPEMPQGDLAGVETAWDFRTPTLATQQTFRTVDGQGDVSRVVTDSEGVAKVTIEGTPQFQAIAEDFAAPVDKKYLVYVTPQLVRPSADSNLQLGMGAFSAIRGGGEGTFGVLTDFMAGMKLKTGTKYILVVRDWVNAKATADISLEYNAEGVNGVIHETIFHFFNAENAQVVELPKPNIQTTLTAEQLKYIPEAERAKVVAALAGVHVVDPWTTFVLDPKDATVGHWGVMDQTSGGTVEQTWNGGGDIKILNTGGKVASFMIAIDATKKIATVIAAGTGDIKWTKHFKGGDHSGDVVQTITGDTGQRVEIDSSSFTDGKWTFPVTISGEGSATVYSADTVANINTDEHIRGTLRVKFRIRKAGK